MDDGLAKKEEAILKELETTLVSLGFECIDGHGKLWRHAVLNFVLPTHDILFPSAVAARIFVAGGEAKQAEIKKVLGIK